MVMFIERLFNKLQGEYRCVKKSIFPVSPEAINIPAQFTLNLPHDEKPLCFDSW